MGLDRISKTSLKPGPHFIHMTRDDAEKQKRKAKDMLGISDDRAEEIFEEQPDRKQQKKEELKEKGVE